MLTLLKRFLYDEAFFSAEWAVLTRGAIAFLGFCFDQNILPTGIDGGGAKLGRFLYVVALFVAAGNKTPPAKPSA